MRSLPVYDVAAAYRAGTRWVSREARVSPMRRFLIGLVLVLLLIVSAGIGIAVARWPTLMQCWHQGRFM
ncbi:MAG: hypothetical protein ACREVV_13305 [Steroidobacteraceae bacterium]